MKPKTILIRARKFIENPEKWTRCGADAGGGVNCAQTAIYDGVRDYKTALPSLKMFAKAIGVADSDHMIGDIWNWNDASERTHADVLAAFDRAIAG